MRSSPSLLLPLLLASQATLAAEQPTTATPLAISAAQTWSGGRWSLQTQVGLPFPAVLYQETNQELQIVAYDLRFVLACDGSDVVERGVNELACVIEDAALSAAPWRTKPQPHAQATVDETARRLRGLHLSLRVHDDGRILGLTLIGEPQVNRRVSIIYENLRQMIWRGLAGTHLRWPTTVTPGRDFVERGSRLFQPPLFRYTPYMNAGTLTARDTTNPMDRAQSPAALGYSVTLHRVDPWEGRLLVQSTGEGTIDIGNERPLIFSGSTSATGVVDPALGLIARRWTVDLQPTASSSLADGVAGWDSWLIGEARRLTPQERPELGDNTVVSPPQHPRGFLPPWPAP